MVKLILVPIIVIVFFVGVFAGTRIATQSIEKGELPPLATPKPTPLARYTIENLQKVQVMPASFAKGEVLKEEDKFSSAIVTMSFDPTLSNSEKKDVTGVVNIPLEAGPFPLVVMIRGYVDPTIYTSGTGTRNAAEYFADNGFLTVAPDFLGYAGSSSEAGNIFETRFQTYTTLLTLLNSIATPNFAEIVENKWDGKNIFIWAHSNGGQVALTTLAITGASYPTTLWTPVTKPFPYSILYYTDESSDEGKLIRRELSKFEELYDVSRYSFTNFLDRLNAPLQFSQGTYDDAIPVSWTVDMVQKLRKAAKKVTYYQYPGADHNMRPAWDDVVARDLEFFHKNVLE